MSQPPGYGYLITCSWLGAALLTIVFLQAQKCFTWLGSKEKMFYFVYAVLAMLVTSQVGMYADTYYSLVVLFGDFFAAFTIRWYTITIVLASRFTGVLVDGFLIWRYFRLSRNWVVTIFLSLLTLLAMGASILIVVDLLAFPNVDIKERVFIASILSNVGAVAADTFIAGFTLYVLSKMKTHFAETQTLLRRLALMTVRSGLSTSLMEIISLISFLTSEASIVPIANQFIIPNLYALTLLVSLNFRDEYNNGLESKSRTLSTGSRAVQIRVTQEHTFGSDTNNVIELSAMPGRGTSDFKGSCRSVPRDHGDHDDKFA